MKRFQFNKTFQNGAVTYAPGAVVPFSDGTAREFEAAGWGCIVPDTVPLLKQGAALMLNCSTPSAKKAKAAKPEAQDIIEDTQPAGDGQ
ncbi:MAG: hypothetical protein IPK76_22945 [Lewinellaceae bacterium]|nr:hypothetical protein [Lewinellaceae bacterium]